MKQILLALSMSLVFVSSAMAESKRLIQVIIDDTSGLQDEFDPATQRTAREAARNMLIGLSREFGRRDKVVVVSLFSATNVWSGQPREIKHPKSSRGLSLFFKKDWGGCSDVLRAFEAVDQNIFLHPAREHVVIFFSSLAHTGYPCTAVSPEDINTLPDEFFDRITGLSSKTEGKLKMRFYWMYDFAASKQREQMVAFMRENQDIEIIVKTEGETRAMDF